MSLIRSIATGALVFSLGVLPLAAKPIPSKYKINGFAVGCQAWTFKEFSVFEAIDKTAEAGGKIIEFFPGQPLSPDRPTMKMGYDLLPTDIVAIKAKLDQRKIIAVNYGVVSAKGEAQWRRIFEFAKKFGLYGITTEDVGQLDLIEKLAVEYDMHVGIHDHDKRPNDPGYKLWDPNYVLSLVKGRDARIGACADTGHWIASDLDPLECIKILHGRIESAHLKDADVSGLNGHCVPFGTGIGKCGEILDELKAQGFKGNISIEYEYNWLNSVPDVKQCVEFVREHGKK